MHEISKEQLVILRNDGYTAKEVSVLTGLTIAQVYARYKRWEIKYCRKLVINVATYNWNELNLYYNENGRVKTRKKYKISNAQWDYYKMYGWILPHPKGWCPKKNRIWTKKRKLQHSKSIKLYLKLNPDKVPYKNHSHSSGPSYPEKYFQTELDNTQWLPNIQLMRFSLDFADPVKLIDLEIDGAQHYLDPLQVESDLHRNMLLSQLGWTIVRVCWWKFTALEENEKQLIIAQIKTGEITTTDTVIVLPPHLDQNTLAMHWVSYTTYITAAIQHKRLSHKELAQNKYRLKKLKIILQAFNIEITSLNIEKVTTLLDDFKQLNARGIFVSKANFNNDRLVDWILPYTKEELIQDVWKTPMCKLSRKYKVSDVYLVKICKKFAISRPPRGYWAQTKMQEV